MPSDELTFFLAFLAVFAGLALYLWRLEQAARALEKRLAALESGAANAKKGDRPG